jgi:hypothetical protein
MPREHAPYRLIQWGTGAVGKYCLQTAHKRPDLEIVAARVYSEPKDGMDVGEIAGIGPIDAKAMIDKAAILALDADIVMYTPLVVDLDDICAILESGKNLITPSGFVYLLDGDVKDRLNAACAKGGVSMYAAGIHPGFAGDRVPLIFSALSGEIHKVTVWEIVDMAQMTESPDLIFGYLGFNMDAETAAKNEPPLLKTMSTIFQQSQQMVAAGLGIEIEEYRTRHEYALTTEDAHTTPGLIKKGHVAGQHFNYEAIIGGKTVIEFKTFWRMSTTLDRDWQTPVPMDQEYYLVDIDGQPGVRVLFQPKGHGTPAELGLEWTAALAMNAITQVCEAEQGFRTTLDLPIVTARFAVDLGMTP